MNEKILTKLFKSQSSSLSTAFSSGGIGWDWGNVFDSSDFDSISGNGSESGLGAWSGCFVSSSSSGSELDVNGGDAELFKSVNDIDGGHHSGVGGRLVSVRLDFHTTGNSC